MRTQRWENQSPVSQEDSLIGNSSHLFPWLLKNRYFSFHSDNLKINTYLKKSGIHAQFIFSP